MPYTHSLVAAVLWAMAATVLCKALSGARNWSVAAWIGAGVFSHWVLDWLVHSSTAGAGLARKQLPR